MSVDALRVIVAGGGLVGRRELASLLGVSRQRMHQLVHAPGFPDPVGRANGGLVWLVRDVEGWRGARSAGHPRSVEPVGRRAPAWMRAWVLARDGACQACSAGGDGVVLEVDHVVPWSRGGRTEPANLQVLCRSCHLAKTAGERHAGMVAA